jgi:ABC-type transporter MlaC component
MKRDDIKSQNPEIARAELARTLAANWKALSEDDKKEYYDLYEKRKETWASEMADYEEAKEEAAGAKAETSGNQEQDHANVESDIMNAEEEEDGV